MEIVAEKLKIPWSITWAPDGTIFFTERDGHLRTIQDGIVSESIFSVDVGGVEGGLLGIALDPNFEDNHCLLYTSPSPRD